MAASIAKLVRQSKSFKNQSYFLSIRSVPFFGNSFTYLTIKRQFTSLPSVGEVFYKKSNRRAFLAFGTAVSLACVLILRERQGKKVTCEKQITTKAKSDDSISKSSNLNATKTRSHDITSLKHTINKARVFLQQVREETGAPGLVVAVSIDGKLVWSEGLGYADVENNVKCSPNTVMRIASISKPLTALAVAKLYEENKLDIDAPIQQYVPTFPQKLYQGKKVTITTRHLLSHLGGIRHYDKNIATNEDGKDTTNKQEESTVNILEKQESIEKSSKEEEPQKKKISEFDNKEYYIKEPMTIKESLALFQDDPLVGEPGESFLYTSHGYTLVSAVVESAAQVDFIKYMNKLFREMGMKSTGPEFNDKITYNRARFYQRGKKNGLVNAPYVNNSYKWAGGGFMSTPEDLVKFGNALLYSSQVGQDKYDKKGVMPGILKPETISEMWKEVEKNKGKSHKDGWYAWGWYVLPEAQAYGACRRKKQTIFHTGGSVGAVSILLLRPDTRPNPAYPSTPPRGIVVSVIMNLQEVSKSMQGTAERVADIFEEKLEDLRGGNMTE